MKKMDLFGSLEIHPTVTPPFAIFRLNPMKVVACSDMNVAFALMYVYPATMRFLGIADAEVQLTSDIDIDENSNVGSPTARRLITINPESLSAIWHTQRHSTRPVEEELKKALSQGDLVFAIRSRSTQLSRLIRHWMAYVRFQRFVNQPSNAKEIKTASYIHFNELFTGTVLNLQTIDEYIEELNRIKKDKSRIVSHKALAQAIISMLDELSADKSDEEDNEESY